MPTDGGMNNGTYSPGGTLKLSRERNDFSPYKHTALKSSLQYTASREKGEGTDPKRKKIKVCIAHCHLFDHKIN